MGGMAKTKERTERNKGQCSSKASQKEKDPKERWLRIALLSNKSTSGQPCTNKKKTTQRLPGRKGGKEWWRGYAKKKETCVLQWSGKLGVRGRRKRRAISYLLAVHQGLANAAIVIDWAKGRGTTQRAGGHGPGIVCMRARALAPRPDLLPLPRRWPICFCGFSPSLHRQLRAPGQKSKHQRGLYETMRAGRCIWGYGEGVAHRRRFCRWRPETSTRARRAWGRGGNLRLRRQTANGWRLLAHGAPSSGLFAVQQKLCCSEEPRHA
jgi:hypothetical protein